MVFIRKVSQKINIFSLSESAMATAVCPNLASKMVVKAKKNHSETRSKTQYIFDRLYGVLTLLCSVNFFSALSTIGISFSHREFREILKAYLYQTSIMIHLNVYE
jgi:hypothetical protein